MNGGGGLCGSALREQGGEIAAGAHLVAVADDIVQLVPLQSQKGLIVNVGRVVGGRDKCRSGGELVGGGEVSCI